MFDEKDPDMQEYMKAKAGMGRKKQGGMAIVIGAGGGEDEGEGDGGGELKMVLAKIMKLTKKAMELCGDGDSGEESEYSEE